MRRKEIVEDAADGAPSLDRNDLFGMADLFPLSTGLPMTVSVSPGGNVRHDVRVKVNMTHGNQMDISNAAVVGVHSAPRISTGDLNQNTNGWCSRASR